MVEYKLKAVVIGIVKFLHKDGLGWLDNEDQLSTIH